MQFAAVRLNFRKRSFATGFLAEIQSCRLLHPRGRSEMRTKRTKDVCSRLKAPTGI